MRCIYFFVRYKSILAYLCRKLRHANSREVSFLESHNNDARAEGDLSVGISGDNDTEKCPSLLWADKYRPRGFMDLLSDTVCILLPYTLIKRKKRFQHRKLCSTNLN